jgi:hypothetical protein
VAGLEPLAFDWLRRKRSAFIGSKGKAEENNKSLPSHPQPDSTTPESPSPLPSPPLSTMAAGQKLYPRATVKKIVKAHSKRNLSKNVDVLVSFSTRLPKHAANEFSGFSSTMPCFFKRM